MSEKIKPDFNVADKTTLVDQQPIKDSFIDTLVRMHRYTPEDAEATYEREARYYKRAVSASPKLKAATGISLCSAFFEIAITGLSIQPGGKAEAFIESRGTKTGQKIDNKDVYVEVAALNVSVYGELNLRIQAGQIIRMNNPIVIYEGDHFQPKTTDRGELTVDYMPAIPRKSKKIIGCWVSMILPHNGIDFKWLLEDDIERLKNYSIPKYNGATPNKLYSANDGQIDPGFLEAKCIKHAFRSKTKLKVSDNVVFEEDEQEDDQQTQTFTEEAPKTAAVQITKPEDEEETF